MKKYYIAYTAAMSSALTTIVLAGLMLLFGQAGTALSAEVEKASSNQIASNSFQFISLSALAFEPVQQNAGYTKDIQRQILSLSSQRRIFSANSNIFIAPLTLPDGGRLLGMTLFGEDFDSQGEVWLRLKRCDHSQARCVSLAETTSTTTYAAGLFETVRTNIPNEIIDNRFFSYFLELELTALSNSGLRSIRLEVATPGSTVSTEKEPWSLEGINTTFPLPNSNFATVKICADDLSHLPNFTHYPFVVVDGAVTVAQLPSNACETVEGRDIEIHRRPSTGPSSGTYEFLR